MKTINEFISDIAISLIGIQEIPGNMGFKNIDRFEKILGMPIQEAFEMVGWKQTHAWCSYFTELIWKLAYAEFDSTYVDKLDKLFSASAVITWRNFKNHSDFKCANFPEPGSVVIWQNFKESKRVWKGHAGIVIDRKGYKVETVEGNTNYAGSREGDMVAKKIRRISYLPVKRGLVMLGFIHPKQV